MIFREKRGLTYPKDVILAERINHQEVLHMFLIRHLENQAVVAVRQGLVAARTLVVQVHIALLQLQYVKNLENLMIASN